MLYDKYNIIKPNSNQANQAVENSKKINSKNFQTNPTQNSYNNQSKKMKIK